MPIGSTVGVRLMEGATSELTTITSALSTSLGTVKDEALGVIGTVLPYALSVLAAVAVVTIGIKVFKKISGARG